MQNYDIGNKVLEFANKYEADEAEVFISANQLTSASVRRNLIESARNQQSRGLGIRVVKDGVSRGDLITNTAEASFDIDYLNDGDDSNDIQFTADNGILNNQALIDSSNFNFEEPDGKLSTIVKFL